MNSYQWRHGMLHQVCTQRRAWHETATTQSTVAHLYNGLATLVFLAKPTFPDPKQIYPALTSQPLTRRFISTLSLGCWGWGGGGGCGGGGWCLEVPLHPAPTQCPPGPWSVSVDVAHGPGSTAAAVERTALSFLSPLWSVSSLLYTGPCHVHVYMDVQGDLLLEDSSWGLDTVPPWKQWWCQRCECLLAVDW